MTSPKPLQLIGSSYNYNEFQKLVNDRLPITICLQEMMTSQTTNRLSNRYHWIMCNRFESLGNGIAGVGIRNDISFQFIPHDSHSHGCIVVLVVELVNHETLQ